MSVSSKLTRSVIPAKAGIQSQLLKWFDLHKHERAMPWRGIGDPYKVWLSEIMLQQTTVATVKPYYSRFLAKWPTVASLAKADLEEIRHEWAGLGYYRRAANLHKCAQTIMSEHGGQFPDTETGLLDLPGIGPYTAAAIASIAFGRKANVVDGNVERVMSRLFATNENLREKAATLLPEKRCGDYAEALMDLGATICTPKAPDCANCPVRKDCRAYFLGKVAAYPAPKTKSRPTRHATAFLVLNRNQIWLRKRPEKGILAGLWEVPTSPWIDKEKSAAEAWKNSQIIAKPGKFAPLAKTVRHTLTHMDLNINLVKTTAKPPGGRWISLREKPEGLPTLTRKIIETLRQHLGKV